MSPFVGGALLVLALLAVLASWEQLRQLRGAQRALGRARRAVERTEERLADTRRALTAVTVQRDGFESDRYAARGEAARARQQVAALSREVTDLRLRLARAVGGCSVRTVALWPGDLARREVLSLVRGHQLGLVITACNCGRCDRRWRPSGTVFATTWGQG